MEKPFAESCVQNRAPILEVLAPRLSTSRRLLEIGSGTGQHAVYFAPEMPWLQWQTSDRRDNHAGIRAWITESNATNVLAPLVLDVLEDSWPSETYDAAFSANTAHIMTTDAVATMFHGIGGILRDHGDFLLYGPFSYAGKHTASSNSEFDHWLKLRDPSMGVRDVDWLSTLADDAGLSLVEDVPMPADNRTLVWRKM